MSNHGGFQSRQKIRSGFLCPGWPPASFPNGIVSYTNRISEALAEIEQECTIFTFKGTSIENRAVVLHPRNSLWCKLVNKFDRCAGGSGRRVSPHMSVLRDEIERRRKKGQLDIFQMEETWGNPRFITGRVGVPTVVRLHGPWFLNGPALGMDTSCPVYLERLRLEGASIAAADAVTSPSQSVLDLTRSHYGLPLDRAVVIPNPIRPVDGSALWNDRSCVQENILFIGRFDRHKGGDVVITAFARLAIDRPDLVLTFCGPDRGFIDDDGRKWSLREFVDDLTPTEAVRNRIKILGQQPASILSRLRRRASVVVAPSRYETFGNTVIEAMAMGAPVVGTDSGGHQEIVSHGVNGLLAAPGDAESLAQQLKKLLDDRVFARQLGKRAAIDIANRYQPKKIAKKTHDFYRGIIADYRS